MADRIQFVQHKNHTILFVDFSRSAKQEMLTLLTQAQTTITSQPRDSVLVLTDFTDTQIDKAVAIRIKEVLVFDRPYVKRAAWVGTENLPEVFYEGFKTFSRREFPTFGSKEEAMEWLVKD